MPDSLHEISIQAPPEKVYEAWTTEAGQKSWWTKTCRLGSKPGDTNVFVFDNGNVEFHFRIDEQVRPQKIRWTGIEAAKMPEEWVGTRIEVDLQATDSGTRLLFGHKGWASTEGAFALCNATWGELMYRLRDACEGKGRGPLFQG